MKFRETPIAGTWLLQLEVAADERGSFARAWCADEFSSRGLNPTIAQCNVSFNAKRGTLRGLHFQRQPHEEAKLVRCTAGAIFDVVVDVRRNSPTYDKWFGARLTAENRDMLYVPEGCAHGFQTLSDNAELFYLMSHPYHPECAAGILWSDPSLDIRWPSRDPILSARDASHPVLADLDRG
jgi:dTDP-4-dehydrorhamnose 3,5-epimerase